jgi:hypothetical protein
MDALGFLIAIAIAAVVFYLYLHKLFLKDAVGKLPQQKIKPASSDETVGQVETDILISREPEKFLPEVDIGHKMEPGIDDYTYQEIIMGPSTQNIYQADDYFEGSPAEDRAD